MFSIKSLFNEGNRGIKVKNEDFERLQAEAISILKNYFNIEEIDDRKIRITPADPSRIRNGEYKTPHSGVKVANPIETDRSDPVFVLFKQFEFDSPQPLDMFGEHRGGYIIVNFVGTDVNKFSLQDSINSLLYHELIHAVDPNLELGDEKRIQKGVESEKSAFNKFLSMGYGAEEAKSLAKKERSALAQKMAEKDVNMSDDQYYNKKIELTAHLNQIIFELERIRKFSPEIIDQAIANRNFDQLLNRIYDWEIMAKHLSPKNLGVLRKKITNIMINKSMSNIGDMKLRNFFQENFLTEVTARMGPRTGGFEFDKSVIDAIFHLVIDSIRRVLKEVEKKGFYMAPRTVGKFKIRNPISGNFQEVQVYIDEKANFWEEGAGYFWGGDDGLGFNPFEVYNSLQQIQNTLGPYAAAQEIKSSIEHELTHIFDPSLYSPNLPNYKYYQDPSEIKAFMQEAVYGMLDLKKRGYNPNTLDDILPHLVVYRSHPEAFRKIKTMKKLHLAFYEIFKKDLKIGNFF